jgi:RNA polymerase sigma-70 factor (ECF subfamily)
MSARNGEFEALYLDERPNLLRLAARRLGSTATAADLVQDVFLRLWERPGQTLDDASAYLGKSVNNAIVDHLRAERVRKGYADGILPEQYAQPVSTPLEIVETNDIARLIDEAIMALPERTRHIFLLNRIHGRSFVEIAGVMDISERAVAKHMARAVAACENAVSYKVS